MQEVRLGGQGENERSREGLEGQARNLASSSREEGAAEWSWRKPGGLVLQSQRCYGDEQAPRGWQGVRVIRGSEVGGDHGS